MNANEACARAKREFSLTNVDADRARTRDAGTRRERDREKTHETLAGHGVRERARDAERLAALRAEHAPVLGAQPSLGRFELDANAVPRSLASMSPGTSEGAIDFCPTAMSNPTRLRTIL